MSAAQIPDPQTGFNNLFEGVHQRVFFSKLASLGYAPQTEKQARDLLDVAGKLRLVSEEAAVKQASDSYDPFAAANSALDGVLGNSGFSSVQKAAADEEQIAIKNAAAQWAADPVIYNSVLAVRGHEAEQLAQQLRQQGMLR